MQQAGKTAEMHDAERKQVEAVVETLARAGSRGESVAEIAHEARNMVTALGLYCDLLEEPGVLASPFTHYGNELRLVAAASRRLVEKLVTLGGKREPGAVSALRADSTAGPMSETLPAAHSFSEPSAGSLARGGDRGSAGPPLFGPSGLQAPGRQQVARRPASSRWELIPSAPIENLAAELLANHNLLAALAGPLIVLTVDVTGSARAVRLTGEDLTRVLVNLVKNAAEAMPGGGRIQIELRELPAAAGAVDTLLLTIEDTGPGIPPDALDAVFASGYTTRARGGAPGSWPVVHRGLGLSISRSIVESAGGRIVASNRPQGGACFAMELPARVSRV